ncbi:ABC transporter substrate-binding protein [Microbacterium sp. 18062]|uniref:ABC transporter substrate-binding protein n=1 Tax=Microbacterium sp. 18062 TaxID=2681410 RepID=UPI00135782FE|nr:ABC transporter substrate-binding protein [Microbacterium sp. 18062]
MRSRSLPLVVLAATGLLLTACTSPSEGSDSGAPEETIEITTPVGSEISAPAEPQAALGFYTTDVDILATLGFSLAGTQPIRDDYTAFPDFFPAEVKALETFGNFPEYSLEAVLAAEPDFILNGLGYEEDLDGELQKIAPTYTYNAFDGSDWRDSVTQAARDLGCEDRWQQWVDAYDARIADIRARLDDAGIDPVVADLAWYESQATAQYRGVPCLVFADLGLRIAPITNAGEDGLPSGDATPLSTEQLGRLDGIDVVFSVQRDGAVVVEQDAALQQNALWTSLPFVQEDRIHGYDIEMTFGSPSGQDAFLTLVEQTLLG